MNEIQIRAFDYLLEGMGYPEGIRWHIIRTLQIVKECSEEQLKQLLLKKHMEQFVEKDYSLKIIRSNGQEETFSLKTFFRKEEE